MATDLAEFLGAAIGFYLLLHLDPVHLGGLAHDRAGLPYPGRGPGGFRRLEACIMAFVAVHRRLLRLETFLGQPDWLTATTCGRSPIASSNSIYVAVGMLGATVMPHVIYLHSALVQRRVKEIPTHGIRA